MTEVAPTLSTPPLIVHGCKDLIQPLSDGRALASREAAPTTSRMEDHQRSFCEVRCRPLAGDTTRSLSDERRTASTTALAIAAWAVTFAIATSLLLRGRVVANCWLVYAHAAEHWLLRTRLYDLHGIDDFQYFPQAAIAFIPLERIGAPWSGVAWRALGWAAYACASWRMAAAGWSAPRGLVFLAATILLVPVATISLLNGQANLHAAALMMHAVLDLREQRRWRATLWLTIGVAVKPFVLALALLACVVDPALIWRLALSLSLLALSPLATAPTGYVVSQYQDCARKLALSAEPRSHFEDLRGLLWRLGWTIPYRWLHALAAVAALASAALCRWMRQRRWTHGDASLLLYAVAVVYLMLFNTRTQANSYVMIAPVAALPAALFALHRRWRVAVPMSLAVACWYASSVPRTACWLKPLACIGFAIVLVRTIVTERAGGLSALASSPTSADSALQPRIRNYT